MRSNLNEIFEQTRKNNQEGAEVAPALAAQPQTMSSPLAFVTPVDVVDLPSKGQFYPEGHPLKGASTLEIKQMTAKEEDILTNKSFIKKGLVLDKLIESLIVNKSINPETLLMGDKNAIVIAARIGAYGPGYDVALTCPACGAKNTAAIDLNAAKVKDADAILAKIAEDKSLEFVRYNNGNIILELPKTKWLVECKLITGADEKRLLTYLEKKRVKDASAEISISEQLALIIVSVNLASDNETVMTAINNMPASDAKFLRDSYQKLVPNVVIGKMLTCSSCLEEQDLEVPFTQEFFWPR